MNKVEDFGAECDANLIQYPENTIFSHKRNVLITLLWKVMLLSSEVMLYYTINLHFTTVCKNIMLIVSLSGRGIVVLENRHTSLGFLMHNCMWLPSQPMPHLLGKRISVFKWVWWNISRQFKTTLCMPDMQKFSLYLLCDFKIFIWIYLIIDLDVKASLNM